MGAIILGKMHLRWCDKCNLPVLEQRTCSTCRSETRAVKLTPPGDARPAFESDIVRIRTLIDSQFGAGTGKLVVPDGAIALLNKAPDIDRMDEVIVDGIVVGAVRFALASGERFLLRPEGAEAISRAATKSWAIIDPVAAVAVRDKSASTLAVGILECDPSIRVGDEVMVLDGSRNAVSVGISKMDASDMMQHKRGTAVKTRWVVTQSKGIEGRPATWAEATAANTEMLDRRTREAVDFVKKTVKDSGLPVAVSYSGGKDSLATLLLVLDAGIRP
ncbi:MAG TPA: PUA domain-containing protein, partial [Thermoplasmata archaeon]